jgi:hypothetical protein
VVNAFFKILKKKNSNEERDPRSYDKEGPKRRKLVKPRNFVKRKKLGMQRKLAC